jgi:IPT/TIG domain
VETTPRIIQRGGAAALLAVLALTMVPGMAQAQDEAWTPVLGAERTKAYDGQVIRFIDATPEDHNTQTWYFDTDPGITISPTLLEFYYTYSSGPLAGSAFGPVSEAYQYDYALSTPGLHNVNLRVANIDPADPAAGEQSVISEDLEIEVLAPPFVDFTGQIQSPDDGTIISVQGRQVVYEDDPDEGVTVAFFDRSWGSAGTPDTNPPVEWTWYFEGGSPSSLSGTTAAEANPLVTYTRAGVFRVSLEVRFQSGPTLSETRLGYVKMGEIPTCSLSVTDLIKDTEALVPLQDWTPVFLMNMIWDDDETPAVRNIFEADFLLKPDPKADDRAYNVRGTIDQSDIYQIAIVYDMNGPEDKDEGDGEYTGPDPDHNEVPVVGKGGVRLLWWPNGELVDLPGVFIDVDGDDTDLHYTLDLSADNLGDDYFDLDINTVPGVNYGLTCDQKEGRSWFLMVRTTATWAHGLSLAYFVDYVDMSIPKVLPPDNKPRDEEGARLDSFDPDFFGEDPADLDPETAYSSSFSVFDFTGGADETYDRINNNIWQYPNRLYTPLGEYVRPRWDAPGTAFDFVTGEWLHIRRLAPLDNFTPVLGINAHGTGAPEITEVNVILTDVGADPFGPAGNGGFDPRSGLESFTSNASGLFEDGTTDFDASSAVGVDHSFNGVNVFHDTNNNATFDEPAVTTDVGISFAGNDFPMWPYGAGIIQEPGQVVPSLPHWEYVPFPPGGGDPWWKIRLVLGFGRRRKDADETPTGYLEVTPDSIPDELHSGVMMDYFVTVRPDSGFTDASLVEPGDGTSIRMGADFRAFIEPRRFNANSGHLDGGIHFSSMMPPASLIDEESGLVISAFQDDPRWGASEPWWPQRTHNRTTCKPVRVGAEVHDLVMTYEGNNLYRLTTEIDYGLGFRGFGYKNSAPTWWDDWLDPYALVSSQFFNGHTVGASRPSAGIVGVDDSEFMAQYPYETVPFFNAIHDTPPEGPRSAHLTTPPPLPTLPTYGTWPAALLPGEFPMEFNWLPADRQARYLKQHIEPLSLPTAMLGFNLVGADDPLVNEFNGLWLRQITVAFWGPDFDPTDLLDLDTEGTAQDSGVFLAEDGGGDGVFGGEYLGGVLTEATENALPLDDLEWPLQPEYIDVDGDGVADDMSGDGVVDEVDKAWVLRLTPQDAWFLPVKDAAGGYTGGLEAPDAKALVESDETAAEVSVAGEPYWAKQPMRIEGDIAPLATAGTKAATKALGPSGHVGDDLFLVVQTSGTLSRFEQFRALVPATLPSRPSHDQAAGIQLEPQVQTALDIYKDKGVPEEGHPFRYFGPDPFGMDMIEANVACQITDLTGSDQVVFPESEAMAVLGIDLSTNRTNAVGTVESGSAGSGSVGSFTIQDVDDTDPDWADDALIGKFLVDSNYESYEIIDNTTNINLSTGTVNASLFLRSGTPEDGAWRIVRDPTFLEQIIVEFYDEDRDGHFNINADLMPLVADPELSGVAIYRDNDLNPANTNGQFDEGIDIPVVPDYAPFRMGLVGEPNSQVMVIFSTPGTDDVPAPLASQPRRRQWVYDSLGDSSGDAEAGPDFFVVIRTSAAVNLGDDFRVAIVSWGPNTPTEPDPDTFPPSASTLGQFDAFSEFPWGARGIGLISFFNDQPYYNMYPQEDLTGRNWVRSSVNKWTQTTKITVTERQVQPDDVIISSVSPTQLSKVIPAGGTALTINGLNFGTAPTVKLDSLGLTLTSFTGTSILAMIPGGATLDSDGNGVVVLSVTNSITSRTGTWSGFEITTADPSLAPSISYVSPNMATKTDFPVAVLGDRFDDPVVKFGSVQMPVEAWSPTRIDVALPPGGMPITGLMHVTVTNKETKLADIALNAFTYTNPPGGPGVTCFIATAAYGSPFGAHLDTFRQFRDSVLLKTGAGTALVETYYSMSPALANLIADRPWLAASVRVVLTPVAWALESPGWFSGLMTAAACAGLVRRRRRVRVAS